MLKLVRVDDHRFDLALLDAAGADVDAEVATIVYAALYTDGEAPADRVPERFERRGWYEDETAGTGLWYVRRQPLTESARREAIHMIRAALMRHAPALKGITVTEVMLSEAAGNTSSVSVQIGGLHNGRQFLVRVPL